MSHFFEKLRGLSEIKKKIIIAVIVGMLALVLGFFWIKSATNNISQFGNSENSINLPNIDLPNLEIPDQTADSSAIALATADWKTYTNTEYGFEFKYPPNVTISSLGPNDTQKSIDKGQQISGTTTPSYNTITISDNGGQLGKVEIFSTYKKDLTEDNYKDSLYLYGPCDLRWGFTLNLSTTDTLPNDIKVLAVHGQDEKNVEQNCNYVKNSNGNIITISNKGYTDNFGILLASLK